MGCPLTATNYSIHRISPARLPDTTNCADATVRYLVPSGDSGFCFDANGRHKRTIDLHTGQALYTFAYDANGVLSSIKDPGGLTSNVATSGTNFVISPPAPGDVNQKTTVTISGGHATNISDNIGSFQPKAAANGLLSQLVDGENNLFTFTYDTDGYLASDTSPLGTQKLERTLLPGGGKRATLTSPLGLKTVFETTYDATNVLTHKTIFPDLTTELKTRTPAGLDETTSRDGTTSTATTSLVTQLNGQIPLQATQTVKLPSGLTMTTKRLLTDPAGGPRVATVMFDDTATPPTQTSTTSYTSAGQTVVTTSPEGRTTTVKSDGTGHITQRQIGTLTPTDLAYINGQLSTVTQGSRSTTYTYVTNSAATDAGYLFQIQNPISTTEIRRDLRGRPLSTEVALGTTVASKTSYAWYNNDLLKTVRSPELNVDLTYRDHQFSYDAANEITQYLPPALTAVPAPATNYTYSSDRNLLTEQPPGLASMTRAYLASSGQLDTITLPATSAITSLAGTIDYDYFTSTDAAAGAAAGLISKIAGPSAGNTLSFKYDGNLRTSQSWTGDITAQVTWLYNNRFWSKKESLTTAASFDRFFGYDKDGLLVCNSPTTCNPPSADALSIRYSPIHGGVTLIDQGGASGAQETWSYSDTAADQTSTPTPTAFGELRKQSSTVGGTAVADIVYDAAGSSVSERRDALGRIRFKTETFRNATSPHANATDKWEYRYDERGQLKTVYRDGSLKYDATYDRNGNIKQYATAAGTTSCVIDAQDRLTRCTGATGTQTFIYQQSGELKTKTVAGVTWTYHYDSLGRLRVAAKTNGPTYEYVLDGEGRRIAKKNRTTGALIKGWVYGKGFSPIAELDGTGAVSARYIYGSRRNTPDLVIRDGKTYRLISDQLGTPRYAVNVADKDDVPYQVSYSALGVATPEGGLGWSTIGWIPFGFAGGLYDPDTGLVHFGVREYDPQIGRWISRDPIRFEGDGPNLYLYVGNDPINRSDPSGLKADPLASPQSDDAEPLSCDGGPGKKEKTCPSAGYCARNYEGCSRECVGRGCECCERVYTSCSACQPFNFRECLK